IAGGEPDDLPARSIAADGAERVESFGQGELLAHEATHYASPAQLAAHLEAAVDAQEIPPGRRARLAQEKIAKNDAVAPRVVALEPAPGDVAGEAQLVEPRGLVACDARGQHLALPSGRRQLEALELLDDALEAVAAVQLLARLDVLPGEEEAHEIGRAHRLDLAAEPVEGAPMDARQEAAVAPLDRVGGQRSGEAPAKDAAFGFDAAERRVHGGHGQAEGLG